MRWKALIEMEKQQQEQVDRNIKEAREKLEMEMEAARHEHQVMLMRQGGHRHFLVLAVGVASGSPAWIPNSAPAPASRFDEAPGGAQAHGGAAQPGGAEAQTAGTQVRQLRYRGQNKREKVKN